MIVAMEALEAWCPPTLMPDVLGRTLFAWWMMDVASHRTRRSIAASASSWGVVVGAGRSSPPSHH